MNKYFYLSLLLIILIAVNNVSCVNLDNNTNNKNISMSDNDYYNPLFNKLDYSFNFLYSNSSFNK